MVRGMQQRWAEPGGLGDLIALLERRRVAVLTGAGISTESGIPDYRGPETRRRTRSPVQYQQFVRSEEARRRYWARSFRGWPRFSVARPNAGHEAVAALEAGGAVIGVVTQNVDRLHHRAGSQRVIELHGALAEVRCLQCEAREPRARLQQRLRALNPGYAPAIAELAPDGDAELAGGLERTFEVPPCEACGGVLKPDVVFFGENVPRPRVEEAWAVVDDADALLVVGSSLAVFSGYRFVRGAAERGMPIAIVNLGETRGDPHATLRVDAPAGEVLPRLAQALGA